MKSKILVGILTFVGMSHSLVSQAAPAREVSLKVEAVDGKTHWIPEKFDVIQGETLKIKLEHNLPAGFAFHGFEIPVLNIHQQVNRGTPLVLEVKIPSDLAVGEYPVNCQFHAAHVGSSLVVKAAPAAAKKSEVKKN